jgi:DNA-binding transcriptional MocR family regulator
MSAIICDETDASVSNIHPGNPNAHFPVPARVLRLAAKLKPSGAAVYLHVVSAAIQRDNTVSVSTSQLAERVGVSQRTVFSALDDLERMGLIERLNASTTAITTLRVISDAPVKPAIGDPCESAGNTRRPNQVPENSPTSAGASGEPTTQELVARAYSPAWSAGSIQSLFTFPESELRLCLKELHRSGGVSPNSPIGVFVGAMSTVHSRLFGSPA